MKNIFLTYFPVYHDIHLFKDPGQVPFRFKKVFGYESYIITTSKDINLKETKKYLKLIYLPANKIKRYKRLIGFFIKNRKKIKVFNIFHIGFHNIFIAWLCKMFVPGVFIYLKMDNCIYTGPYPWEKIFDKTIIPAKYFQAKKSGLKSDVKNFILRKYLIKIVDLFSVEDDNSRMYYENKFTFFKDKIFTVYNGHVLDLFNDKLMNYDIKKENIILNIARLGTYQKATEILLEAFAKIADRNNWELHLAGKIDDSFKPYLNEYFGKYPKLKKRIIFHGYLNKMELFQLYQRAKIFCLPSRFETFANVYPEAMYFKNAIITTTDVSPKKIIEDRAGIIVEKDNVEQLADGMQYLIDHPEIREKYGNYGHEFAKNYLNWDIIIKSLYEEMKKRGLRINA